MSKWYSKTLEQIYDELTTDPVKGITQVEATSRLSIYGKNILPRGKKVTWVQFLLRQFKSPLIYILIVAAVLTTWIALLPEGSELIGDSHTNNKWVDTIVILLAIAVNVAVGFWQEFRSNNILEKLEEVVQTNAYVIREGKLHEINSEGLVPGDVILLKPGKKVPADARIVSAKNLEIDESLLTGESVPVKKLVTRLQNEEVPIGDRDNMIHMGTLVSRGEGVAVIVATGRNTAFGKIALLTQLAKEEPTPLQIRMDKLGSLLAVVIGIASVLIFVVGVINDYSVVEMMTTAVAVAVAAIPEGLPAAISIILAVSAQKILKKKGVIKKLVAAEALGSTSVICTDKTGTLTEGRMVLKQLVTAGDPVRAREILAGANEGIIEMIEEKPIVRGETTDQAKLRYFIDEGGDLEEFARALPRISLLSFDADNKYIASLHKEDSKYVVFVTGAPETVLDLSTSFVSAKGETKQLTTSEREKFSHEYEELAKKGYRVLGIAERKLKEVSNGDDTDLEDKETKEVLLRDLVFVGYAAIGDPIRADVRESIAEARNAGIRTIMMTGDHILTAVAIGKELGFGTAKSQIYEGKAVEGLSDDELEELVSKAEIFARVDPEHKMRIIAALQRKGEVVAMTGDGINDAPALKSADIGIAVGSGTDIAKAASDLILLDDSFSIIVESIRQGRIAFDNIRKVTVYLLTGSFTELILIMVPLLMGLEYLPLTAVLILWTNLIEDSLPNIALSFEPGEDDVMNRPPVRKEEPVLDKESKIIIFAIGLITDFALLGVFFFFYYTDSLSVAHLQTLIFAGLGLDTSFYIYSIKNLRKSIFSYNIFSNKLLVGATVISVGLMLAAIYVPGLNNILETVPLTGTDWMIVISLGIIKLMGIELVKWWFIHRDVDRNGVKDFKTSSA